MKVYRVIRTQTLRVEEVKVKVKRMNATDGSPDDHIYIERMAITRLKGRDAVGAITYHSFRARRLSSSAAAARSGIFAASIS